MTGRGEPATGVWVEVLRALARANRVPREIVMSRGGQIRNCP
jgi:hypothetical protein